MTSKIASLLLSGITEARVYTKHTGYDCYDGYGAVAIDASESPQQNINVVDCQALCDQTANCVGISHDSGSGSGDCWRLSQVDLPKCDLSVNYWDTYTVGKPNLESALQDVVETVVSHYRKNYPNLTISVAWKDASNEVAAIAGSVRGRDPVTTDTFLYGSGTKPFTAAAVMRLVDSGLVQADDKAYVHIDPYMKSQGKPTLAEYFGEAVNNATVVDLIAMMSGIRDFEDDYTFDVDVLTNGSQFWDYPYASMDFAISETNAKGGGPLYFTPPHGMAYSSTGYEVAGLLLAAVREPSKPWYEFDFASAVFPDQTMFPNTSFPPYGKRNGNSVHKLHHYLTVPGMSIASTWPTTTIFDQDPSFLGWTCGNMVASPTDVARFFYHLMDADASKEHTIISDESRKFMSHMRTATAGWEANRLVYGAGLMALQYGNYAHIDVTGHEGDTYGFVSSQGYAPSLKGAYSIVTNIDKNSPLYDTVCLVMSTVHEYVTGKASNFRCQISSDVVV